MGEKFAANPVTGTGSMSVPIATSPGRSGFGPQLSLSYDSGAGNGPFGFGWSLSLPTVTRKTDKGLPRYCDQENSDVFVLSGAEDLVPMYRQDDSEGAWAAQHQEYHRSQTDPFLRDTHQRLVIHEGEDLSGNYHVRRYRPRIEGLFARIERWSKLGDPTDVHWRSLSKDNILTVYGLDAASRIADPLDPSHIFSWLICETRDATGNAILYRYKSEDGNGIETAKASERNRGPSEDPRRTANRYLKRIHYGNRQPLLDDTGQRPTFLNAVEIDKQIKQGQWLFEVVFDYGEHFTPPPLPEDTEGWKYRPDPFSSYRSGFEVRTNRLCQRVLMFHNFEAEPGVGLDCLVRSTDFSYTNGLDPNDASTPIYTFLRSVTQSGYRRNDNTYKRSSLPAVEFEYTQAVVQDEVEDVAPEDLKNLPVGLDGSLYQWIDLHGEGIPGILTEQAGWWYYKRNLSPATGGDKMSARFAPIEQIDLKPNLALAGGAQFLDLAGDGQPDLVLLNGPTPGLYEHDCAEGWHPFRAFISRLNRDMHDPNLRFIDLDGDGHADVLVTETDVLIWHPSLGEAGFGPANRVVQAFNEETGPRIVFSDGTESIYLADLSGDGLTDIARIRNGEICYWPNLGYGRFGAKVTMDNSPWFDNPDQFDQKRIRLADIDGSGTTDVIYLHRDGVRIYFNQSGNSWSPVQQLKAFLPLHNFANIIPVDLMGNGTACLVWSSPLPGNSGRQMRYIKLMGEHKPHLLVRMVNNLGTETRIQYAPSSKFYLQDKQDGKPWITRLPYPVHVVERVETLDHISRNHFAARYAYHHGYFDGEEREFRGFGMVEQWDTEQIGALTGNSAMPEATNLDPAFNVPPIHTKTWYHTGIYTDRKHVSDFFAGLLNSDDTGEYYRTLGLSDDETEALLLPDTVLPPSLTLDEEREACRALRGQMLRQEVYTDDAGPEATPEQIQRALTPFSVIEQNFTVRCEQPRGDNQHAVFFTHARETLTYHYERNPVDPRIQHALTLQVDNYGNVLKSATIGYGRRVPDSNLPTDNDRQEQIRTLITYTENSVAGARNTHGAIDTPGAWRPPMPADVVTYELTGISPGSNAPRFSLDEWIQEDFALVRATTEIPYEQVADYTTPQKRPIERVCTLFRSNDLTDLLPLGELESLAMPGEAYKLSFTPGLLAKAFMRDGVALLPEPENVVGGQGMDQGGYVDLNSDGHWWVPSGRIFLSPDTDDTPEQELAYACQHFFLPLRRRDPFGVEASTTYDPYDLLMVETRDALGNRITVGERLADGHINPSKPGNDYRVLKPWRVMDPNHNRSQVAFDILGMVVGNAVMGKPEDDHGDSLDSFAADLPEDVILEHLRNPLADPLRLLGQATSRLVYDLFAYQRTQGSADPQPSAIYTIVRETHNADLLATEQTKVQHSFSYSDGFGRVIQKKIQAEPKKENGEQSLARWVGSGWTVFNNKGKPVHQYEPFFSALENTGHRFEFGVKAGISPVLFYDPSERVAATLHPNNTYEKVVFDPWQQTAHDVNDTVLDDPRIDADIAGITAPYFANLQITEPGLRWETWHAQRQTGALGPEEQAAAAGAEAHARTPTTVHFDTLGRPFLTVARNKVVCQGHDLDGSAMDLQARIVLDIEGNQREVHDSLDRIVMHYTYDMLGNRIRQASMEAGARWILNDVTGKAIRAWDNRGHTFRTAYDVLRRPLRKFVVGADPIRPNEEILTERLLYGEQHPETEHRNLRGKLHLHFDQAGIAGVEAHDFKGNPLQATRRLSKEYKKALDWHAADAALPTDSTVPFSSATLEASISPLLENEIFASLTQYDALNRPVLLTTPHTPEMRPYTLRPGYNEANLLERVDANLRGETNGGQPVWAPFVTNIDYDAKGQRQRIDYGNGTTTLYEYDPFTFRLIHLLTRRSAETFPADCPQPPSADWAGCHVQNLHYTYDPAGNITHIHDNAQQAIYFRNQRVEPSNNYTYDALYRLIEARGREHVGQAGGTPSAYSADDVPHVGLALAANDGQVMGRYIERYVYDAVGNFLKMQHSSNPAPSGWTRTYTYGEASLIEHGNEGVALKTSNRLSSTTLDNNPTEPYAHDAHGNMVRFPHLPLINWDYRDQLQATARQIVKAKQPETTYYVYDANGQRIRKVTERAAVPADDLMGKTTTRLAERVYLGGFEIYREYKIDGITPKRVRESLHIMDDKQRIAIVETRTLDTEGKDLSPERLTRYQFGNHLGSASLELDDKGQIISYEEYSPYGSTTYQAVSAQTDSSKQYRYTGKERDEESGLYYYGARYYAAWLGRWTRCDPIGVDDGSNLYQYVRSNPVNKVDVTGRQTNAAPLLNVSIGFSISFGTTGQEFGRFVESSISLPTHNQTGIEAGVRYETYKAPSKYGLARSAIGSNLSWYAGLGWTSGAPHSEAQSSAFDVRSFAGSGPSLYGGRVGYGQIYFSGHFAPERNVQSNTRDTSPIETKTGNIYLGFSQGPNSQVLRYGNDNLWGDGLDGGETAFFSARFKSGTSSIEFGAFDVTDRIRLVTEDEFARNNTKNFYEIKDGDRTRAVKGEPWGTRIVTEHGIEVSKNLGTYQTQGPGVSLYAAYVAVSIGGDQIRVGVQGKWAHDYTQGLMHRTFGYHLFPPTENSRLYYEMNYKSTTKMQNGR
nr:SpvB/TcaC N-terminal domain-containing protein [Fluviibacter phosphoraccumulans]